MTGTRLEPLLVIALVHELEQSGTYLEGERVKSPHQVADYEVSLTSVVKKTAVKKKPVK